MRYGENNPITLFTRKIPQSFFLKREYSYLQEGYGLLSDYSCLLFPASNAKSLLLLSFSREDEKTR
ncbi:hypothetical protein GIX45_19455 [Erwinia sp. CPCC 100877]|nr:hypothetical protein [Erwinia sp. CPCC 100877]